MGTNTHRRVQCTPSPEDEEAVQDVGVHLDESASVVAADVDLLFEDVGVVDFKVAGARVAGDFRCTDCGYGAVVQSALPPCPMCGGTVWESRGPLGRRSVD
jgi:rubrerythrin